MGKQNSDISSDEKVIVIAERKSAVSERVSRLINVNGKIMCECPYACGAAMEPCDYDAEFNWEKETDPVKKAAMKLRLQIAT